MSHQELTVTTMESEEVAQAYDEIHAFFDCYGIIYSQDYIKRSLTTATSQYSWKGEIPFNVIYFFEQLEKLLKAAFILVQCGARRSNAIVPRNKKDRPDLTDFCSYCGWYRYEEPWDCFPRFLSKKEYFDPYKALRKVVNNRSLEQWKNCFDLIVQYSLSTDSLRTYHDEIEPLEIYRKLSKLLDACHLIEVRANEETRERVRKKWKVEVKTDKKEPKADPELEPEENKLQT